MTTARKILIIDDDHEVAALITQLVSRFRRGPFVVAHAADYERGLQALLSGEHALCLLDYNLGSRTGLELLREAKQSNCTTPVIVLTGANTEGIDLAALEIGAVDYLEKIDITKHGLERAVYYALELTKVMAQLRELAIRDKLTGLLNRREFDRHLQEECQRSIGFQRPLALVMIDLDRFKQINDRHGHPVGDEVLRHVAGLLAAQVRPVDCLARYGGDEFALIMVEAGRELATAVATQLRALLAANPCRVSAKSLTIEVNISTGVATSPEDAASPAELLAAADAALYSAKRQGVAPR